uniref:RNA 3'-terminal phosphate cyclase n=1 Tax=Desulfobacca acetoxidans TaxID=60893 RepID=A0A7V4G7N4_9BACT
MRQLDGAYGEGGGQIVRTALSLAALLEEPVRLVNIRGGRAKPGLRPQHLTAVKALAQVTQAEVEGAVPGGRELTFRPHRPRGGRYFFDVAELTGSAGSVTLVAQTLLPVLLRAPVPSSITIRGGTHVAWSPPAHYFMEVFLPALAELGVNAAMTLQRWGWYPRGGGEVRLTVAPAPSWHGRDFLTAPRFSAFRALSAGSRVPSHVITRQARRLQQRLGEALPVTTLEVTAQDPGSLVFLWGPGAGFHALGARGKPAEQVADEVAEEFLHFQAREAALDRHLADQLLLYLALAQGPSVFITEAVTSHLLTNLWVIEQFLGLGFEVRGNPGERGIISCRGGGSHLTSG